MSGRYLTLLFALTACALPAASVLAQPIGPDGSKTDNERLLPGLYPAAPEALSYQAPAEPVPPPFEFDWSIGLKGTITGSTTGGSFATSLTPQFTATHDGQRADIVIDGSAEVTRPWGNAGDQIELPALRLGVTGSGMIDSLTQVSGNIGIAVTQQSATTPGLSPLITAPPQVVTGSAGLGIERSFGRFNAALRGTVQRTNYGPTTRSDTGVTDNSHQNVWETDATLRVGYQLTPIFEVFSEGSVGRDMFDRAAPATGVRSDATSLALRGGISGSWNDGLLTASASVGVGRHIFDSASLGDVSTVLYDASVTYSPTETLNLSAALNSTITPAGADASGAARIAHTATASVNYTVNSWLRLRASADWGQSQLTGSGETERSHGAGAGADYLVNAHTALSADYGYDHRNNSATGLRDTHTVTLGVTLRR